MMIVLRQPVLRRIARECSRLLLWAGAAVFFVGDAFLYEIKQLSFLASTAIGILGGALLMLLAAGIAVVGKSPRPEQR
jgi:hypothetical protein